MALYDRSWTNSPGEDYNYFLLAPGGPYVDGFVIGQDI